MADAGEATSLIDAAQQAAAAGDYAAAERLLRKAAAIQEASLGSEHPDLATTLNNLAFVCERTGKYDEAEQGYRRAHAIAVASLSPGHPFIKTSLSNLVEFCELHGISIWKKPETPLEDEPLPDDEPPVEHADVGPGTDDNDVEAAPLPLHAAAPVAEIAEPRRGMPLGLMAAAVVLVVILVAVFTRQGQGRTETRPPVAATPTESVARAEPVETAPSPPPPQPIPAPTPAPESTETSTSTDPSEPATASVSVTVLKAQLCSTVEKTGSPDWHCAPASGVLPPGTYMFYTRLQTTAATTVEHRWYRGDRVHQTMRLRVSANPGSGYRTFSATTVSPERAGEWKVELRAADGTVLEDARFRVQ
jgi:hypothetical protein